MNNLTEQEILQEAMEWYGEESQLDMLIEECSEVIHAVLKRRRANTIANPRFKATHDHLMEELADLQIVLDQMYLIFPKDEIEQYREQKINRLKERLGL